jgi:DNA-binding Lrp family transcriptional regulator
MYQPDQLDWKIIALLNQDGRMSSAEIARRLKDVTARTVTNRIEVLTEHEIIHVRSIVNPENVGYGVLADVFVEVEPDKVHAVAKALAVYPQISYVACSMGDADIIISIRARSITELFDFVLEVVSQIPGVQHTETYPLPLKIKTLTTWIPPNIFDEKQELK